MIIRILTDEIATLSILVALVAAGWFGLGSRTLLFAIGAALFAILYCFCFLILKVFAPALYMKGGSWERCKAYSDGAVNSWYSIVRNLKIQSLDNYYRIYSAYASVKLDDIDEAARAIQSIEDARTFKGQFIQLRIIKAFVHLNNYEFGKAIALLVSINTGTLSPGHVHELFYLLSACYIETDQEKERALNYARVAYNLKAYNQDYKLNYGAALFKCGKAREAKILLGEIYESYDELSNFGKSRLLFYLFRINNDLGNVSTAEEFKSRLMERFPSYRFS